MTKNKPVYIGKYIFNKTCYLLLVSFITCRCLFKSLALLIRWLVFLLSLVHLTLSPFFLKVLRIFRTFKLLKDGCPNSRHFNTILLCSKIITNTKDRFCFWNFVYRWTAFSWRDHEKAVSILWFYAKQTKLAIGLLKYWHFNQTMFQTVCCVPIMKRF